MIISISDSWQIKVPMALSPTQFDEWYKSVKSEEYEDSHPTIKAFNARVGFIQFLCDGEPVEVDSHEDMPTMSMVSEVMKQTAFLIEDAIDPK